MRTYQISHSYSISYLVFSMFASIPSAFLFTVGIITRNGQHLLFWGSALVIVWGSFIGIRKNSYGVFWISLITSTVVWLLLLLQTIIRIQFIIEYGGMERSDGYGSPVAFLIGLIGEQIFFVPLCFVVIIGWVNLFGHRRRSGKASV
jgi:hypothetical protein